MNTLKKRIITFMAALFVSVASVSGAICVSAQSTTPVTGNGTVTIQQPQTQPQTIEPQQTQTEDDAQVPVPTAIAVTQQETGVVEITQAQRESDRKYSSKGFVVLWFFLAILINLVLSFMISNRFYKMAKRENHIHSEIRALRRDLEEKFLNSVGGFTEMETDITNTNENYSTDGSIEIAHSQKEAPTKENDEVFRQWENKMARRNAKTVVGDEAQDAADDEEVMPSRRKYSPSREEMPVSNSEEETKVDIIKNKAKGIINNIFPFKD